MQEERMEEFSRLIQSDDFIQFVQYLRVRSVNSLLGPLCVYVWWKGGGYP